MLTVAKLAKRIGADLVGDGSGEINAVGPVEAATKSDVTFITDGKYVPKSGALHAGAVIVAERINTVANPQLIVDDVNAALIEALNVFAPKLKAPPEGIDPTAKIGEKVKIGRGVSIGAGAVIDDGVEIGRNSVFAAGCKIGQNSKVGENCRLDCNVVVYHNCCIGNNVVIQANSTIGSTGFGYSFIDGEHKLIPHNGGVIIEDFVEIGTNCCIDRAKFENTIIGAGTKIDNLVQIAHNVIIGKCCLIAAQCGIAGGSKLGDGVVLGGQVGLKDNIKLGDGVVVGAQSGVGHNVEAGQQVFGSPARDIKEALRIFSFTKRLPKLAELLRQLDKRVEALEAAKDDKK